MSGHRPLEDLFLDEMVEGYLDGRKPDNPEPSVNRSASYRHGFANGRDDLAHSPRATAQMLRLMADKAINEDVATVCGTATPRPASSLPAAVSPWKDQKRRSPAGNVWRRIPAGTRT
jgi:hypothetical protein